MLNFLFGPQAAPVTIRRDDLFARLDLNNERLEPDPKSHIPVLRYLNQYTLRGSFHHGPAKSYFAKPVQTITIKADPPQFRDLPQEDDKKIRSSAHIAFTEEPRSFGRRVFYLMISKGGRTLAELDNSLIFGLVGITDKEGNMTIKEIMGPGLDSANRLTPVHDIPITAESMNIGILFAKLCAQSIYSNAPVYTSLCLGAALGRTQYEPTQNVPD